MAQRQFRSDDTSKWTVKYGSGADGVGSINDSTFAEANETFTGTSGATTGIAGGTSFADGDCVLILQTQKATGAGVWELNKVASGGGTANLTFKYALTNTYAADAQIVKLKQYSSLTVNTGQTWTAPAWNGTKGGILAFLCNGTTTINGMIQGSGKGFLGGVDYDSGQSWSGGGVIGDTARQTGANGNGGGGGQEGAAGGGGGAGGGNATAGTNGETTAGTGGTGGEIAGNAALTIVPLGGGGGKGGPAGAVAGGNGGNGGAFILIISKKLVMVTGGEIRTYGLQGDAGAGDKAAGGGGGAGGSILLKCQTATLGTNLLVATSLGGGDGPGAGGQGGIGSVGRIHLDYLTSVSGTTNPTLDSTQDATLTSGNASFLLNFI